MPRSIFDDGEDHPADSGEGLVLKATFTNDRTLELTFKNADTVVSEWTYEVSADDHSLMMSTAERRVVFGRVE